MENTLENKAKFFAQYWGQKTVFIFSWSQNQDKAIVSQFTIGHIGKNIGLELKPLSAISDEDVEYLTSIWGKGAQYPSSKDESINLLAYYASRDYATMAHDIVDYLRSKGYALPFLGLSVKSQISYGWVKLAEVC